MNSTFRTFILLFLLFSGLSLYGQDEMTFNSLQPKLMAAEAHTGGVYSVSFSTDGKYVVTASGDKTTNIWELSTGKLVHRFEGHTGEVRSATISPNGKFIVTASNDNTARIWELSTGKLVRRLEGHTGGVSSATISPNGKYIVTASRDSTARIWELSTGKLVRRLEGHTGGVSSANISPDGKYIVTASQDSTARAWELSTGKLVDCYKGHTNGVSSAVISPDGKYVVTTDGVLEKTARIWEMSTGKLILPFEGNTDEVSLTTFSPDGKYVVTASRDSTARVWELSTGKLIHSLVGHKYMVSSATFSPNGKYIVTTDSGWEKTARIWEISTGKLIHRLEGLIGAIWSANISPDGNYFMLTGQDKIPRIWNMSTGKLVHRLKGHTSSVHSATFSPDGKHFVTASSDESARIWNMNTGKLVYHFEGHTRGVRFATFNPEGNYIMTTSWGDKSARIWDMNTGKLEHRLEGHTRGVNSATFSPDGNYIMTTSYDSTAMVWEMSTGKLVHHLQGHKGAVQAATFSPDSKYIVLTQEKTAKISPDSKYIVLTRNYPASIWEMSTGKLVHQLEGATKRRFLFSISPKGKQVVTSSPPDSTARIWEMSTGKLVHRLEGHTGPVYSATISPDGNCIVTASRDKTARIWEMSTGKLIHRLEGHKDDVNSAIISPDGKHIVTTSNDNTARIWELSTGKSIHDLQGHKGAVRSATFSPDGHYIMTVSFDDSVIFWKADSGKQQIKLRPLSGNNWIVFHSSGLFDATPQAMKWMYYVVGMEVIELNQLKERYYEPGLFEKVLTQKESLRDVEAFTSVKMYPKIVSSIKENELHIHLQERNGGIGKVSLFVNNKEVIPDANQNRDTTLSIDLTQFEKYYLKDTINTVSIRAFNADGWLKSSTINHTFTPKFINKKGKGEDEGLLINADHHDPHLYAVVIGTSDYVGNDLDLRFADKDSKDIAYAIKQSANLLFGKEKVHIEWFTSTGMPGSKLGSKQNIKAAIDSVAEKARAEDVLLLYFSGHGKTHGSSIKDEQFYYLTKDVYSGDLSDPQIRSNYAISMDEMTQWINSIAAQKQVMILDACSSGKVVEDLLAVRNVPTSQIRALDRMKDRTGMFVLAGSAADKVSYEASQFGQGLLTYSLLLGMDGAALKDGKFVDVMDLFQFARDQVPEFASDIGGVQVPTLAVPTDASSFDIGLVSDEIEIPLQQVKPLFSRSNLFEKESWDDVLGISKALDSYLIDISAGPLSRGVIFIDVNAYEKAYSIKGQYNLEADKIYLQGRLFKGKERLADFKVIGNKNETEKLVDDILDNVANIIDH